MVELYNTDLVQMLLEDLGHHDVLVKNKLKGHEVFYKLIEIVETDLTRIIAKDLEGNIFELAKDSVG